MPRTDIIQRYFEGPCVYEVGNCQTRPIPDDRRSYIDFPWIAEVINVEKDASPIDHRTRFYAKLKVMLPDEMS
jgi:hypothetical protein